MTSPDPASFGDSFHPLFQAQGPIDRADAVWDWRLVRPASSMPLPGRWGGRVHWKRLRSDCDLSWVAWAWGLRCRHSGWCKRLGGWVSSRCWWWTLRPCGQVTLKPWGVGSGCGMAAVANGWLATGVGWRWAGKPVVGGGYRCRRNWGRVRCRILWVRRRTGWGSLTGHRRPPVGEGSMRGIGAGIGLGHARGFGGLG